MKKLNWKHKVIFLIVWVPFMSWLTIFNVISFDEYEFVFSENNAISALQHMTAFFWGCSTIVVLVISMVVPMFVLTNGLDLDDKDR